MSTDGPTENLKVLDDSFQMGTVGLLTVAIIIAFILGSVLTRCIDQRRLREVHSKYQNRQGQVKTQSNVDVYSKINRGQFRTRTQERKEIEIECQTPESPISSSQEVIYEEPRDCITSQKEKVAEPHYCEQLYD
ncbi:uncharacterized protein [Antedon mediterranea]|uniref:uncharacterized protein n=1 Tax=Antedon mediterranea TaxID=105859 RepID=UPI003AF82862